MKKLSRLLAASTLTASAVQLALHSPQLAAQPGDDFGILVMAHGGGPAWDAGVLEAVAPLRERYPLEVAFGMADAGSIQDAASKLEERGARDIAVVRLFISGESWYERTQQILGLTEGAPSAAEAMADAGQDSHAHGDHDTGLGHDAGHAHDAGQGHDDGGHAAPQTAAAEHSHAPAEEQTAPATLSAAPDAQHTHTTPSPAAPHSVSAAAASPTQAGSGEAETTAAHGGHAMGFWRIDSEASFRLSEEGLAEAAESGEVLLDRALALSTQPATEDVLLLAHGPGSEEENARWLAYMDAHGELLRQQGFHSVKAATLREDWPEARELAEQDIRAFVAASSAAGRQVIVLPFRVHGFGPYAQVLEGLEYRADETGLIPHPAVTRWIERQALALREASAGE